MLGKHALWREEGRFDSYLKVNGQVFRDTANPNIPRHAIWKPGMTWDSVGDLDPDVRHPQSEGASDPEARIRHMDAMGIDQAFLYPTWFAEGFHLVEDPDVSYALARAYNDWIADFCSAAPERLYAAAMVPLGNMDFALANCGASPGYDASGVLSSAQCSWRAITSLTPATTRYGPSWKAWA